MIINKLSNVLKNKNISYNYLEDKDGMTSMEMSEQMLCIRDCVNSLYYLKLKQRMYSNLEKMGQRRYLYEFRTCLDEFDYELRQKRKQRFGEKDVTPISRFCVQKTVYNLSNSQSSCE